MRQKMILIIDLNGENYNQKKRQLKLLNQQKLERITEVKLEFDSTKPLPIIYEIVATQRTAVETDKTALKTFIDKASGLEVDKDKCTKDTWVAFETELNEDRAVYEACLLYTSPSPRDQA